MTPMEAEQQDDPGQSTRARSKATGRPTKQIGQPERDLASTIRACPTIRSRLPRTQIGANEDETQG